MRTIAAKIAEMKAMMETTGVAVPKEKAKILTGAVEYMKHLTKVASQKSMQLAQLEEAFNEMQQQQRQQPVSYTHLTLPTKRIV